MTDTFDAIIIGAGQAGSPLAVRLAEAGMDTCLIEREHLGGTCVNDGCIPTKTLVASARVAHVARDAARFGVDVGPPRVDMARVKARKDAVVQASIDGLTGWFEGAKNLTVIRGEARLVSAHAVEVGGRTLSAPKIFLNTGGRATVPDWPGLADTPYLTNTTIMAMDHVPEHLIIAGGSYIGLEFAQMYRRFGARVTVFEYADRLIAREDADVSDAVRAILEAEGIEVRLRVRDFAVQKTSAGVRLRASVAGAPLDIEGDDLLLAVGRRPNVEALNLPAAGVALDARGYIQVDGGLATSAPGIWALGDVNGRGAFTHTSYNDYQVLAANLLNGETRSIAERIPAYALYTDPPLGRVGLTEAEVRASGRPALIATRPMSRVGRAFERGETAGFMKVLVDAETQAILGAALLGVEGDEVVHTLIDAMAARTPATTLARTMHIHPTVSELIPTLLEGLAPLAPA
ncbi:MAG TPA: FAD-containing oxidoreductase [Caulobacteraceae bacterium]|jgi:pyruvate/2-oxoglutarate dehydrogenase complex dihydrolipoamide dehydrogenase (E3) component|nr:FAD-containing oxidoreductase [Caulobacteraceae bacterium]